MEDICFDRDDIRNMERGTAEWNDVFMCVAVAAGEYKEVRLHDLYRQTFTDIILHTIHCY